MEVESKDSQKKKEQKPWFDRDDQVGIALSKHETWMTDIKDKFEAMRKMMLEAQRQVTEQIAEFLVNFSSDEKKVKSTINRGVMEASILLLANEKNKLATMMRDKGDVGAARQLLLDNATYLGFYANMLDSKELEVQKSLNTLQSLNLDEANWVRTRKQMRRQQFKAEEQQSY